MKHHPSPRLPLYVHLLELRQRLIVCLAGFFLAFVISYMVSDHILNFLAKPLTTLFAHQEGRRFIYTSLTEAFVTYLQAALFGACIVSIPLWIFHLWRFVSPAFSVQDRRWMRYGFGAIPLLFLAGVLCAYYGVCPLAWKFFLSFESKQLSIPLHFEAKIGEYLGLTLRLMLVFGFGFQLPVLLMALVGLGIVSVERLKQGRKIAFLGITFIAALITPPDLISPLCLMVPLYGLYEGALLACSWVKKDISA
jgi:sec-independent protein translocase protein TatC